MTFHYFDIILFMSREIKRNGDFIGMDKRLEELRKRFKTVENIQEVIDEKIFQYFKNHMGYKQCNDLILQVDGKSYNFYIKNHLLISYYYDVDKMDKAINLLTNTCEDRKFEWGILFHRDGIVLINSQIPKGNDAYRANKVVFKFEFSRPGDAQYFRYLQYDNLLVTKNANFFRDIIIFRNTEFDNSQKSWALYLSATRRLFDYFCEHDRGYDEGIYDQISITVLEQCLKANGRAQSEKYIKNQFRYVNKFIRWKAPNGPFVRQGVRKLLESFQNVTSQYHVEQIDFDSNKLQALFKKIQCEQNAERNQVLLLLMFSYGMDRKQLCMLRWNEIFDLERVEKAYIKINSEDFSIPTILVEKLLLLKNKVKPTEKFVLGNCYTKNVVPLSEEGINSILASITGSKNPENVYPPVTVAKVRRWLFKYLVDKKYNLVAIMKMMNISVSNLKNYIGEDDFFKIWRGNAKGIEKESRHPMEEFVNEIFI